MSLPTAFETQLYLHTLLLLIREVGLRKLSAMQNAMNGTLAEMPVQLVQKGLDALTKSYLLEPLRVVIQPNMWFNPTMIQFQVLSHRADGFVSRKQTETVLEPGTPLLGPDSVDVIARDRLPELDAVIRFLCYLMMESLS